MGRRKVTEEILVDSIVEEKIERVEIEENVIDPVVEELVEKGQLYAVFDNGLLVAAVFESNPVLDSLLEYNKKQLEERIKFLHDIVTDENEICKKKSP